MGTIHALVGSEEGVKIALIMKQTLRLKVQHEGAMLKLPRNLYDLLHGSCLEGREEGDRSHVAAIPHHNEDGRSAEKVKKAARSAEGQREIERTRIAFESFGSEEPKIKKESGLNRVSGGKVCRKRIMLPRYPRFGHKIR